MPRDPCGNRVPEAVDRDYWSAACSVRSKKGKSGGVWSDGFVSAFE